MFENGRSALAALLGHVDARVLWLPAYVCEAVSEAARAARVEARYYALDGSLDAADCAALERRLRRGDCVLGVDFFGRLPASRFRRLAAARRDVLWIEDRAHALAPGPAWGDWLLYSPRKLLGVPDGGIIAAGRRRDLPHGPAPRAVVPALAGAQALRAIDPLRRRGTDWFALYRKSEARQRVTQAPVSALTLAILRATDARSLAARRRENYALLHRLLGDLALFPRPGAGVPFAFPIRVRHAEPLARALARAGVYAQRHWAELPSPKAGFGFEHGLAAELLTLPCDQRYGAADMRALARMVRALLR